MDQITRTRDDLRTWDLPAEVPVLLLRSTHVFPLGVEAVQVTDPEEVALLRSISMERPIVAAVRTDHPVEPSLLVGRVGVAAIVIDRMNLADNAIQVTLLGKHRVVVDSVEVRGRSIVARVSPLRETDDSPTELSHRIGDVLRHAEVLSALDPAVSPELVHTLEANIEDASHFADIVASQLPFTLDQRDAVVSERSALARLVILASGLSGAVERALVRRDVDRLTSLKLDKTRREYLLRQQLEALRAELGEDRSQEVRELAQRLAVSGMPAPARAEAERELERLGRLQPASAEYQVSRTYLDLMLDLPWAVAAEERRADPAAVRAALERDHYGLEEAKQRIVEYLAVRTLAPQARSPVLCLVGPPGVGKTSLGRSVAEALGLPFGRLSVGGVDDEAAIRGHRRTYVGAMPGKIVQEIRRLRSRNAVLMIDEIDKLGSGRPGHGDPSSALLEVLDPEQNFSFADHYLNVPFDLSRVLFIATANTAPQIPPTLLDRMEVIEVPGYTLDEKVTIASRHSLPRLLQEHGLVPGEVTLAPEVLGFIAKGYAREAGMRGLMRQLAAILRNLATRKAGGEAGPWVVDEKLVDAVLGQPAYADDRLPAAPTVGMATGLAWTSEGGDILAVEAVAVPGSGAFQVTGSLGDVMLESVQAAATFVRSRAEWLGLSLRRIRHVDVHVHFPEGAIPKDGPSAGITIAVVLASLFTGRPVRHDIAMTGEITITGRVLAVGGLREKLGAAVRNGIPRVIIPSANESDLREVPETILKALSLHLVGTADEALALAFAAPESVARPVRSRRPARRRAARNRSRN